MDYNDALARTPEEYRHFIQNIARGGNNNGYMTVDGRVQWATDECKAENHPITIETQFTSVADQFVCFARVVTPRGIATAHARAFMDGRGVDATNPLENAETSAVGRALGFLGYGVFSGIASHDEVSNAIAEQDKPPAERPTPNMAPSVPSRLDKPTEKQLNYLSLLLEKSGLSAEEQLAEYDRCKESKRETSKKIEELKNPTETPKKEDDTKRRAFWAQAKEAMAMSGKTQDDMRDYMVAVIGKDSTSELTDSERADVVQWLSEDKEGDLSDDIPEFFSEHIRKRALDVDSMPVTWTSVQLLCDDAGIAWEKMEGYMLSAEKVDDLDHAPTQAIRRVLEAFKPGYKGKLLAEVANWGN